MAISGRKPVHGDRVSVLVKFPPHLLEKVLVFQELHGLDRMAAIVRLVERGLGGGGQNQVLVPTDPKPPPEPKVTHVKEEVIPRRSALHTPGVVAQPGERVAPGSTRQSNDATWSRLFGKGKGESR